MGNKKEFLISEMYRLEVHWKKAIYEQQGVCRLMGAYFSGPALSISNKINPKDHILVDFCSQYLVLVKSTYVAKLSWNRVIYDTKHNKVFIKGALLEHQEVLNKVPKLDNKDYLVIDTSEHEEAVHMYNLLYPTYVVNKEAMLYNFKENE